MKSFAMTPLLLALSATLLAQSKTPALKTPSFPPQITHLVVIVQENRTPRQPLPLFEPALRHSQRCQRLKRVHTQPCNYELLQHLTLRTFESIARSSADHLVRCSDERQHGSRPHS
jgi:hypothetical protein